MDIKHVNQLIGNASGGVGPERLVGHFDQRRFITRMVDHPVEFSLLTPFVGRLQLDCPAEQIGGQCDHLVCVGLSSVHRRFATFRTCAVKLRIPSSPSIVSPLIWSVVPESGGNPRELFQKTLTRTNINR